MFEIRSHARGTDVPVAITFADGVLEWFVGGTPVARCHVHGITAVDLVVDKRADIDLRVTLADDTVHVLELPAEARPEAQLLVANLSRERDVHAA